MLFPEENAPHLKKWIVKRLENISDADADVLADYVLALLRHDGDSQSVRALCEAEIPDFLKEDSAVFVRDVFNAIQYGTYLPGAPQASQIAELRYQRPPAPSAPSFGDLGSNGASRGHLNGSRKRSYNESDDGDRQDGRHSQFGGDDMNGRVFKQPRRGGNTGNAGRYDKYGSARGSGQGFAPPMQLPPMPQGFPNIPPMPTPPPGLPPLDPNNPMASILAMQAMGFPIPGMSLLPQPVSSTGVPRSSGPGFPAPGQKQRCRDYDTKGFCARGNSCKFEHGMDSIYVPPGSSDEYDPANSSIMTGIQSSPSTGISPSINIQNYRGNDRGRGHGGGVSRGGRRSEFSSDRPNYDRSKTAIVVENIPEEKFSEADVRTFFSEFGTILSVTMKAYKHLAIVKYEDWSAAKAAFSSPKVIFDNRFVKVYWYLNEESLPQPPAGANAADSSNISDGSPNPVPARATAEPQIDIEEFTRRQNDIQKVHEEKMKKKAEMETAQKELEKRQEELSKSQAEEKKKLMERIAAKSGKSATPSAGRTDNGSTGKPGSQTEALKAQLAALEAEAKSLGIDPVAGDDSSWNTRGRGRGRVTYRGRSTFVPRGYRGSDRGAYRGRGGTSAASAGYKLDNRPKKVAMVGVDFTEPDKDESLRQYLLGIGEFTQIEATPSRTSITFVDRFTAEKFIYGTTNGELPSIGKVEMAWVQTPLPPVPVVAKVSTPTGNLEANDDARSVEGDAMAQDVDTNGGGGQVREQQELDYDVGDDNDWGVS